MLEPGRADRHYWRDLWAYRELFAILAWRDVAVRYKQTVFGVAWALVRPFITMVIFTVVFSTALNVKYRDFRYIIPFVVQFGLYVSPVGFSSAVIPEQWRFWYSLNPMVGVIDGFRWCILGGTSAIYLPGFLLSLAIVALLLWIGISYFRHTERTFADLL